MNCPVCNYSNIVNSTVKCPNCQTNLTSFKTAHALAKADVDLRQEKSALVQEMEEQSIAYEAKIQKKNNIIGWMTIGFLSLVALAFFLGFRSFKAQKMLVQKQRSSLKIHENSISDYEKQIKELSTKLNRLEQTRSVRELKYKVKKGDVLHELGELFYNDSDAGIQIALDNKIYDIRGLPVGETLTIKYRD